MWWFNQGLCALPAFLVVCASCNFIVPYVIAVFRRDVDVVFPYISDAGATPPESCVFGLMTFITAYAAMATIYSRYKFVEKLDEERRSVGSPLNKSGLWVGMGSCLGMCVVATFQETTETAVHDGGALLFFITGVVYIILQTIISYKINPPGSSKGLFRARLAIGVIAFLAFFPTVFCAFFVKQTTLHRHREDKDFALHVTSAVCEWIVAFSFVCFFLTYIDDFKLFTLHVKMEFTD